MNQYESMNDFRVLSRVHFRVQYRAQYREHSSIVCRGHFRVHLSLLINRLLGCSAGIIQQIGQNSRPGRREAPNRFQETNRIKSAWGWRRKVISYMIFLLQKKMIWQCAKNVCIWGRHHRTKVYPGVNVSYFCATFLAQF